MAGFCVSCGAPLSGAFCNKCGARAVGPGAAARPTPIQAQPIQAQPVRSQPAVQAATPAAGQASAAPAKSSGLGKILLIVGGVLLVLFVLGVGAAVYGAYWVKHKVTAYASAVKSTTGGSSETIKVVENGNSCRLLSTAELQQALGVTIERSAEIVENDEPGCAYYTNQAAFTELQRMAAEVAKKQVDAANNRPGPKPDNLPALMKNANDLEGVVKTLALTQPVDDGKVFSFTVQRSGGADAWAGMHLVQAALPGYEEVSGLGDHAMMGAFGHVLFVQKGDAVIALNTLWVPDARGRGAEIAKKILGNL
jgi:hypothetical protein